VTGWSLGGVTVNSDGGLVSRPPLSRARRAVAELDEPWAEGVRTLASVPACPTTSRPGPTDGYIALVAYGAFRDPRILN